MTKASPLTGYNTGLVYRGRELHVQTEDSGVEHPHVITHLFADGGRIIATRKTSYAARLGSPDYAAAVRELIRAQHKAMIVALRDGAYDDLLAAPPTGAPALAPAPARPAPAAPAPAPTPARPRRSQELPVHRLASSSLDEIILADLLAHLDD